MKKLLLLFLLSLFIISCKQNNCHKQQEIKKEDSFYKKGDVVYLKPDSIRAIIVYVNSTYKENYDVEFYVLGQRVHRDHIDTIYFYNNKKLKQ